MFKTEYKNKRYWITLLACLMIFLQALTIDPNIAVISIGATAGVCTAFIGGDSLRASSYNEDKIE